jgi:lipopolysaccharide transport system ATP-binding protein
MNPNFVVAFIRSDNVACCNYNTAMDGFVIPFLEGEGTIEAMTPRLKLVSELYNIHVLVWDKAFQRLYSAQQTSTTFHVRHQLLSTHFGVFHESAQWSWRTAEVDVFQSTMGLEAERS